MKRSSVRNFVKNRFALTGGLVLAGVTSAHAAVPAAVTTGLSDMQADVVIVATALVVAAAAIIGLKWMKAALFG